MSTRRVLNLSFLVLWILWVLFNIIIWPLIIAVDPCIQRGVHCTLATYLWNVRFFMSVVLRPGSSAFFSDFLFWPALLYIAVRIALAVVAAYSKINTHRSASH
jgi:hypothetical protein